MSPTWFVLLILAVVVIGILILVPLNSDGSTDLEHTLEKIDDWFVELDEDINELVPTPQPVATN